MLMRTALAASLFGVIAPSIVIAQTPPPPPPTRPVVVERMDTRPGADRMQSEAFNRALTNQAAVSPARANRAERVAALINEGRCEEAIALARSERDNRLARRAEAVCESPPEASAAPQ